MQLGSSKVDITPNLPIDLSGYAHRKGKSVEVFEHLFLKTFVLRGSTELFLIFVADLIWWDDKWVERVRNKINSKYNISQEYVCFHATHNHSGPQTSEKFSEELGLRSNDFMEKLEFELFNSVDIALNNLETVMMYVQKGKTDIGVYRRKRINDEIIMAPDENVVIDNRLTIISFEDLKSTKKAMWIHATCHPTTTDANSVSGEFPGFVCKQLEAIYPECNVAFLQGFCGDIRPKLIKGDRFYRGSLEDMIKVGQTFTKDVIKTLNKPKKLMRNQDIEVRIVRYSLEFSPYTETANKNTEHMKKWIELIKKNENKYNLSMQFVQIGQDLKLLACNAELVQEYSQYLWGLDKDLVPLGYSNGMVGYISTHAQLLEGGYEPEDSIYYFGLPGKLSEKTESTIKNKLKSLLKGEKG